MMDIVERLRSDAEDIGLLKTEETDRIRQKYKVYGTMVEAADEIERLRKIMETVADALYDKGDYECWAALRNALWQEGEKNER